MSIVTSTVAACLEAFEVDEAKYSNIDQDAINLPLTSFPDDMELARLVKSDCTWSSLGVGNDHPEREDIIAGLHTNDFVCLAPNDGGQLYEIAQIQSIHFDAGKAVIILTKFKRMANPERTVVDTGMSYILEDISRIKRVCWVSQSDSTDCDFSTTSPLKVCRHCQQTRTGRLNAKKRLHRPRTLSLFGGAGGMDVGLALSHFRTSWMIDSCEISCQTFSAHHPNANVIQLMVGDALLNRDLMPTMPKLGEVDAIVMGPPCQPFSKINRQSREEREQDPRSLCIATGLSFVETYRPTYGIIENVCGILENGNLGKVKGNGIIKFVLMCLATLRYQARIGIVKCSEFGIPQSRKRVIVLFALEGVTLPNLPIRTHITKESVGLYPPVTIADATSDLPRWDVTNPEVFAPSTNRPEEKRRLVPPAFRLRGNGQVKGPEYCQYSSRPQTIFQQQMRLASSEQVADHYILAPFEVPSLNIERFWHIPCHPSANHLSLQGLGQLEIPGLLQTEDEAVFKNAYGRLDLKRAFPIIITSISLRGKSGRIIMPDQHRTPSIRELARAQGFPDGIRFSGTPSEMLTQIGNAVPVPLAVAVGESIIEAMVRDYLDGHFRFAKQSRR